MLRLTLVWATWLLAAIGGTVWIANYQDQKRREIRNQEAGVALEKHLKKVAAAKKMTGSDCTSISLVWIGPDKDKNADLIFLGQSMYTQGNENISLYQREDSIEIWKYNATFGERESILLGKMYLPGSKYCQSKENK